MKNMPHIDTLDDNRNRDLEINTQSLTIIEGLFQRLQTLPYFVLSVAKFINAKIEKLAAVTQKTKQSRDNFEFFHQHPGHFGTICQRLVAKPYKRCKP